MTSPLYCGWRKHGVAREMDVTLLLFSFLFLLESSRYSLDWQRSARRVLFLVLLDLMKKDRRKDE